MPMKRGRVQQCIQPLRAQPVVNQKQSTETVQVMLFGSISTLFYYRGLFPRSAYDSVAVDERPEHLEYASFVSGVDQVAPSTAPDYSKVDIYLLRKGRSSRVDSFLKILETGVFDALQRRVLSRVQIDIINDVQKRDEVLETYTFTVRYKDSLDSHRQIDGLQFSPSDGTQDEADDIHNSVIEFIQQVDTQLLNLKLGPLPHECYMTAYLRYVDGCDEDYEPPGFESVTNNDISFPSGNGWNKKTGSFSSAGGVFHNLGLDVSYMEHESGRKKLRIGAGANQVVRSTRFVDTIRPEAQSNLNDPSTTIPAASAGEPANHSAEVQSLGEVTYMDLDLLEGNESSEIAAHGAGESHTSTEEHSASLDHQVDKEKQVSDSMQRMHLEQTQLQGLDELSSQWQEDMQMREDLRKVHEPEHVAQYSVPTQQVSDVVEQPDDCQHQSPEEHFSRYHSLLQKVEYEMSQQGQERSSQAPCPCGIQNSIEFMIKCVSCGTSQHAQCHGYLGLQDPRAPKHHICYPCLLGNNEPDLLVRLCNIAALRQTMHILLSEGLFDTLMLAARLTELGLNESIATSLIERLKAGEYISTPRQSQRHLSLREASRLHVRATEQGKKQKENLIKLFNPFLYVDNYYDQTAIVAAAEMGTYKLVASQYPNLTSYNRRVNGEGQSQSSTIAGRSAAQTDSSPRYVTPPRRVGQVTAGNSPTQTVSHVEKSGGSGNGDGENLEVTRNKRRRADDSSMANGHQRSGKRGKYRTSTVRLPIGVSSAATPGGADKQ